MKFGMKFKFTNKITRSSENATTFSVNRVARTFLDLDDAVELMK